MKEELTEYGRDFVEKRMVELSRYAAKQDRLENIRRPDG